MKGRHLFKMEYLPRKQQKSINDFTKESQTAQLKKESTFRKIAEEQANRNKKPKISNQNRKELRSSEREYENTEDDADIDLKEIDNFLDSQNRIEGKVTPGSKKEISIVPDSHLTEAKLCYKLKNKKNIYYFKENDGKLKCPFCEVHLKNINLHFNKNPYCGSKIDGIHFKAIFVEFMKQKQKDKKIRYNKTQREKMKSYGEESKISLNERHKQAVQNFRARKKDESQASYLERDIQYQQKCRDKKKEAIDVVERRRNFSKAIIFGPIFICSCCARMLYENGVTKFSWKFKEAMHNKNPGFYSSCISEEILVNITFNGSTEKTGHYICHTCKTAMKSGKKPSMAVTNGLQLAKIEEGCHLTELENNLIAQNINFQYIYCLPKSRWAATKKQMISVPVTSDTVLNTVQQLPRMPREAGLIPVQLKRKKEYEGCHKKEFVDPHKIYKVLGHLKRSGHPYYQFYEEFTDYMKRCNEQDSSGYQLIFSWGIGVFLGMVISSGVSGGHLNPAVSVALASLGKLPWRKVSQNLSLLNK